MLPIPHYRHPPVPKDTELYNQDVLTDVSVGELKKLREVPKFTFIQKVLQVLLFAIFGIPKVFLMFVFLVISLPVWTILTGLWRQFGKPEYGTLFLKKFAALLTRSAMFILGFHRISYHGQLDDDARFIVANHICFFDGWLFLPFLIRPLGKKEILKIPGFRELNEVFNGIPVDRTKSCGLTKELIRNANDKTAPMIMILPEGASTSGKYMLRFHLGAFLTDLPVQLCAIKYTIHGCPLRCGNIGFFHNHLSHLLAFLCIPSISVDVDFLESISLKTHGGGDPRKVADEAALKIGNHLGVMVINQTSNVIYKSQA